jgi:hypothetical protein
MKKALMVLFVIGALLALPMASLAGVTLKIAEDVDIDLGFRVQTQFDSVDHSDTTGGGSKEQFRVRRARIRLGGNVTEYVKFFLQTEASGDNGVGIDMRVIDAMVNLHYKNYVNLIMGEWMAPAGRQQLTSSGGLMAIDRPGLVNYNLTWGGRYKASFTNITYSQTDMGFLASSEDPVRDEGVTLFGAYDFTDMYHIKYYAGVYDGIQEADSDKERFTLRAQFNLFDPEPGYFNLGTYLGKKKTVGVAFSYDFQDNVFEGISDPSDPLPRARDYRWWEIDLFADYPIGPGSATVEAAYQDLDLDDAISTNTSTINPRQTQGDGWYVQAGYYITDWKLQPWFMYEAWDSDARNSVGDFDTWRVGLSYFFKGHNANVKVGFEQFKADRNFTTSAAGGANTGDDTINTFLIGFYVTY